MIGLPAAVLPRLGQLLRLLASDFPGEVFNTAGALRRTLAGAGLDLNDLANAIERPVAAVVEPKAKAKRKAAKPRKARPDAPPPRRPDLVILAQDQRAAIVEGLAEAVEDAGGRLKDWDRKFSRDLLDRVGRFNLNPTEKQFQHILRVVATARGEL